MLRLLINKLLNNKFDSRWDFVSLIDMTSQKKTPSEYPLFAFRLEDDKKDHLNKALEEVRDNLNKRIGPNDKLWMKNDVIYEALLLGLPLLKAKSTASKKKQNSRKR